VPAATEAPTTVIVAATVPRQVAPASFSAERAYKDLQQLAVQIGSRVAGSPAQTRAADYLAGQFEAAGLQVERQPFTFHAFEDRGSSIEVVAPSPHTLRTLTLAYSPSGQIQGELVYVDLARPGDFEPAAVRGKIALAKRGETRFGDKVAVLSAAGATAVVIFNNVPGNFSGNLGSPGQVPSIALALEDGEHLVSLLNKGSVGVRLKVDAESVDRTGHNVIATKHGGSRTVVIGGHYDSVQAGPGANDNASGTATALEVARVAAGRQYPFSVRFIAFEAEELGLLGSAHYVRQLDDAARESTIAMINLDMVGVGDRLSFIGDAPMVERAMRSAEARGISATPSRGAAGAGSDHSSFQAAGVPSVFLFRSEDPRYHSPEDKAEHVVPENLAIAGQIVLDLLDSLAADEQPLR